MFFSFYINLNRVYLIFLKLKSVSLDTVRKYGPFFLASYVHGTDIYIKNINNYCSNNISK